MTTAPTVAAPPSTATIALRILAAQGAQTGVVTDINKGSQIRTLAESIGQVTEMQGVASEALAFQVMVYGAWSAFGITPITASFASVTLVFSTAAYGSSNLPGVSYDVAIPAGTVVQTSGGIQFTTDDDVTLTAGSSSVSVTASAILSGVTSNVNALTLTTLSSSLGYPLYVTNPSAATGGAAAESPSQTMARFAAKRSSVGGGTPLGVASAAIGVTYGSEIVKFATCYEPWMYDSTAGAGFTVFVDNGSGSASSGLTAAVSDTLTGSTATSSDGYRPAGVPYSVEPVNPVLFQVSVKGTLQDSGTASAVDDAVTAAVDAFQNTLAFGTSVSLASLTGNVVNALTGYTTGLTILLMDSGGNDVSSISVGPTERAILGSLSVDFTG